MNKVIEIGRLTADPELRQTQNGNMVTQFTVAVNRPYKKDREQEADFISCVAWSGTAEFISKYFSKGDPIVIEGALRTRSYDDRRYPDVKHYVTEVLVDKVEFAPSSKEKSSGYKPAPAPQPPASAVGDLSDFEEVISDSDLPF